MIALSPVFIVHEGPSKRKAVLTADELAVVGRIVPQRPDEPARGSPANAGGAVCRRAGCSGNGEGGALGVRQTRRYLPGNGFVYLAQSRKAPCAGVAFESLAPRPGRLPGANTRMRRRPSAVPFRCCRRLPADSERKSERRRFAGRSRWIALASWTLSSRKTGTASRS